MNNIETNMTLNKIADIADGIDKRNDVITVYKKMSQNEYIQEFVCIFMDNMSEIMEKYRLTTNELRVLFKLGTYLQFGNKIKIYRKTLAEELHMQQTHVNAAIRRLKAVEILIGDDNETYFNPHLFAKGKIDNYVLEISNNTQVEQAIKLKSEVYNEGI